MSLSNRVYSHFRLLKEITIGQFILKRLSHFQQIGDSSQPKTRCFLVSSSIEEREIMTQEIAVSIKSMFHVTLEDYAQLNILQGLMIIIVKKHTKKR